MTDATDDSLPIRDARDLAGAVSLPHESRHLVLAHLAETRRADALVDLFSQSIGLANSVVANNREMAELLLITEGGLDPEAAAKANLPTIFGALKGLQIAEGVEQAKTYGGCAFRLGTCANQSEVTTGDAGWCSTPDEQDFLCHEHLDDKGRPTRKCTGFTQARRGRSRWHAAGG